MVNVSRSFVLMVLSAVSDWLDVGRRRGVVRASVQVLWAGLLGSSVVVDVFTWAHVTVPDLLDLLGLPQTPDSVTIAQATAATMAAFWWIGDRLQQSPIVQGNWLARAVLTVLMGGKVAPDYKGV